MQNTKNDLVTKSNMLIEANYRLGVTEQKIILFLASKIHTSDSEFQTYTLSVKEFAQMIGIRGESLYSEIKKITFELMKKAFQIRIGKKTIQSSWFSYVAYNDKAGTVDIRFDPFLKPYLLELKREFTSYKLINVATLKSSYSIRLYELLKQYEKLGGRTFELEALRKVLGAEDVYPVYANFKQRVILPAQKELGKKTDISFDFTEEKVGKKVDKLTFKIKEKHHKTQIKKNNSFIETATRLSVQYGFDIPQKVIESWEEFGEEGITSVFEQIKNSDAIENPSAYITAILKKQLDHNSAFKDDAEKLLFNVVSKVKKRFAKSVDVTPEWLIKQEFEKEFKKHKNLAEVELNDVWEEQRESLIDDIREIRQKNRLKNKL